MKFNLLLPALSLSLSFLAGAGVMCAGESAQTRIYLTVETTGHFNKAVSASVEVVKKDTNSGNSFELSQEEIIHYYEGCRDTECKKVMIGFRGFKNNFYPVSVSFLGPDYSTSTIPANSRVKNLLEDTKRAKLEGNSMRISKLDSSDMNARYSYEDVVCVTTPNKN